MALVWVLHWFGFFGVAWVEVVWVWFWFENGMGLGALVRHWYGCGLGVVLV